MPSPIQRSSAGSVPASNGATSTTRGLTAALAGAVNATSAVRIPRITAGRGSRIVLPPFRVSTPTSGNDSLPRPRSESPQRDLGHHHHSHQADEPGPDVDGNARLAAPALKRLARLAKRAPTRQLSQLSEPRLVDAKVAKLLCIRYHQPCQLRANHAFLPPLAAADQVNPLLPGLEPPTVAAGADLLQIDDAPLAVGRHDAHLGVEEVDELALAVDGVHDHLAGSVVPGHDGGGVAPRAAAQRPACELGPELVEVAPAQPEHAPLRLGVRRERRRPAQAVAPGGEHRILLVTHQHQLGRLLERGRHVTAERWHRLPIDVLHRLVRCGGQLGLERLLDQGRLRGELGLEREDPWDRLGVFGVVEAAAAPLADVNQELYDAHAVTQI